MASAGLGGALAEAASKAFLSEVRGTLPSVPLNSQPWLGAVRRRFWLASQPTNCSEVVVQKWLQTGGAEGCESSARVLTGITRSVRTWFLDAPPPVANPYKSTCS